MSYRSEYTIHIGSARIILTSEPPAEEHVSLEVDAQLSLSRAKIVKKVETDKFIAIITPNPEATLRHLCSEFKMVEAAGGAVLNEFGELLMIRLRERWDLPKGHIEAGEQSSEAALREVAEECGIACEIVGESPLATTWHAYNTYGSWELKRTIWWPMRATKAEPKAQAEEGITAAEWCDATTIEERLKESYATIKEVVEALSSKQSERL